MNTVQNAAIYSAAVPVTLQSFVLMLHNRWNVRLLMTLQLTPSGSEPDKSMKKTEPGESDSRMVTT
jgi:hypothetical protein